MEPPSRTSSADLKVDKSGWLSKWTNYIKGYRQRWFVLDNNALLSYYRNQNEVGEACRGSINLQEARVHSDAVTNNIVIAHSSQTFHLKAQNELDREAWLKALEYARHRANAAADSDDDEEAEHGESRAAATLALAKRSLSAKMNGVTNSQALLSKYTAELEELFRTSHPSSIDVRTLSERLKIFTVTSRTLVQASQELLQLSDRETRRLEKALTAENCQRVQLQEQLETLARQLSQLERAAKREHTTTQQRSHTNNHNSVGSYVTSDDEEFHDAPEEHEEEEEEGKEKGSMNRKFFSAEIILPSSASTHTSPSPSSTSVRSPSTNTAVSSRRRRQRIPDKPDLPLNLWSIMKNCIGKELSKIPMPVNFSEPLSVLQRITEDLEYSHLLLDEGARASDSLQQMCWVAAYAVSSYSTTGNRTTKPFNPLLGETFECDRTDDFGWRSLAEQVSHHPPSAAQHAEGRGWTMFQEFTLNSRFRGKYLSVIPVGDTHVTFPHSNNHYTYKKVTTTVHNIIVGTLWIDNHGEMDIINHSTGEQCNLKFHAYSFFGKDPAKKVSGYVRDSSGNVRYMMQGQWNSHMDMLKVLRATGKDDKLKVETESPIRLWTVNPPLEGSEKMYHFTRLAVQLNEEEEGVAPTDSRCRPDQRLMEQGRWDEANKTKQELEEKQRKKRKEREAQIEKAIENQERIGEVEPAWFEKTQDELTNSLIHVYKGQYWEKKKEGDWSKCPSIF